MYNNHHSALYVVDAQEMLVIFLFIVFSSLYAGKIFLNVVSSVQCKKKNTIFFLSLRCLSSKSFSLEWVGMSFVT